MRRSIVNIVAIPLFIVLPSTCLALDASPPGKPRLALEWNTRVRYESVSDDAGLAPASLFLEVHDGASVLAVALREDVRAVIARLSRDGGGGNIGTRTLFRHEHGTLVERIHVLTDQHGQIALHQLR